MSGIVEFADLEGTSLAVGTTYLGGSRGNAGDDPLDRMLHCGNMGGFRWVGSGSEGGMKEVAPSLKEL